MKEFHSEPVYNKKYLRARTKFYNDKINTNCQNNEMPKKCSQCVCLSTRLIDSVFRMS